jgi:hypothetical protein
LDLPVQLIRHGTKPRQVEAIAVDELQEIVTGHPRPAWAAALRRSELVGLNVGRGDGGTGHINIFAGMCDFALISRADCSQTSSGQ